jgi:hypothetical protein
MAPHHHDEDKHQIEIQDESRLAELGYKQELNRDWSLLHNFGVSFSIIVSRKVPVSEPFHQGHCFLCGDGRRKCEDTPTTADICLQSVVTGITTLFR